MYQKSSSLHTWVWVECYEYLATNKEDILSGSISTVPANCTIYLIPDL